MRLKTISNVPITINILKKDIFNLNVHFIVFKFQMRKSGAENSDVLKVEMRTNSSFTSVDVTLKHPLSHNIDVQTADVERRLEICLESVNL